MLDFRPNGALRLGAGSPTGARFALVQAVSEYPVRDRILQDWLMPVVLHRLSGPGRKNPRERIRQIATRQDADAGQPEPARHQRQFGSQRLDDALWRNIRLAVAGEHRQCACLPIGLEIEPGDNAFA